MIEARERIQADIMLKSLNRTGDFYKKTLENMEQELMRLEIESYSLKASIRRERLKLNISNPEGHSANFKDLLNVDPASLDLDCVLIEESISLDSVSENGPVNGDVSKSVRSANKRQKSNSKVETNNSSQKPVKVAKTRNGSRQHSKDSSLNKLSTSKDINGDSKNKFDRPSTSNDASNSSSYYFDIPSTSTAISNSNTGSIYENESSQSCPSQDTIMSNITDDRYLDPLYLDPSTYVDPSFMEFDD